MEKDNSKAYSEVIEILKLLDNEKQLEALPMEMLEVLKSKSDPEYKPQISSEIPIDEQNLQPETLSILSWIAMKYWNVEGEKQEVYDFDIAPDEETQKDLKQNEGFEFTCDPNEKNEEQIDSQDKEENTNILGNEENIDNFEEDNKEDINSTLPIAHSQLKWYEKIKIKIIEFINKLFRRNK